MNAIRETSGQDQYRLLENFWASQIRSKAWLINTIKSLKLLDEGDVYIFGGWYGILASLIRDTFLYNNIYSVDIDPECEVIGTDLDNRISFITCDMAEFVFTQKTSPALIINTSTEHITQEIFDRWKSNMPSNVPIILQGNDFFQYHEHVRCAKNLNTFVKINNLNTFIFSGELDCKQFTRFMTVGYK